MPGIRMSMRTTWAPGPWPADRLLAVGGFACYLDVVLGGEERSEPRADEGLVVGEQDRIISPR